MAEELRTGGLNEYVALGRTGLKVSRLCRGAMTFGNPDVWGSDESEARSIVSAYRAYGGNFIDTANVYAKGESETILGRVVKATGGRDSLVLASKFSLSTRMGDPNAGGNGRKTIYAALDETLGRLQTDYLDLYWLHAWDMLTPVEEVVSTLDALVRAGKIRYYGLSDVPAWILTRAWSVAEANGSTRPAAAQLEFSLLDRTIEAEHIPACREMGIGICPWSPLGGGMLSGKYARGASDETSSGTSRLEVDENFRSRMFTDANFALVETLRDIAGAVGRSMSQVALNWIMHRPGVSSTIIGARRLSQLEDNIGAMQFALPPDLVERLSLCRWRPQS